MKGNQPIQSDFLFSGMLLAAPIFSPPSLSPSPIDENAIKCYFFFFSPRSQSQSPPFQFLPLSLLQAEVSPFLALLCRDCSRGLMGVLAPNRMGGIKEGENEPGWGKSDSMAATAAAIFCKWLWPQRRTERRGREKGSCVCVQE